jgi:hypothetical protein
MMIIHYIPEIQLFSVFLLNKSHKQTDTVKYDVGNKGSAWLLYEVKI